MPLPDEPSSSPLTSKEDALTYYKLQYEQLEAELADFQASSRELETELEKDVEAAEKRERQLQEKVEGLGFEVDEWKSKCKQSKAEANAAQNTLQKEITNLRDANRTLQLKLRDIEVANDDFERQARNTTSSLEDLESKYNVGIERCVLLEEEIKIGELEREGLRIETQRLRDELSDLKVEAEIRQDKLRHAEAATERRQLRRPAPYGATISRPQSSISEHSPTTTTSSPTIATPPTKSVSSVASDTPTPPSPPVSDKSLPTNTVTPAQSIPKSRLSITSSGMTPRPPHYPSRTSRHSRGPSLSATNGFATPINRRKTLIRPDSRQGQEAQQPGLPSSTSLSQIRGLIGKMQKLEQRVQSARSKLPPPVRASSRASPRPGSALSQSYIPATVTMRSRKRTGGSNANLSTTSSIAELSDLTPTNSQNRHEFSLGRPISGEISRPSSRTSISSHQSNHSRQPTERSSMVTVNRPSSRQSITGRTTPLGHYSGTMINSETRARPRSSIGGSYASSHGHTYSASVNRLSHYNVDEGAEADDVMTPTPSRRKMVVQEGSGILLPGNLSKRHSGAGLRVAGRRTSSGPGVGDMGPPLERTPLEKNMGGRKLSEVGETY